MKCTLYYNVMRSKGSFQDLFHGIVTPSKYEKFSSLKVHGGSQVQV
jgi:hypothetical protein